MSGSLVAMLLGELGDLTKRVLARAAASQFGRTYDERGAVVTGLQPSTEQQCDAADDRARLLRWQATVTSILRRRGSPDAAEAIDQGVEDLDPFVRLTRRDIADVTEDTWRASFHRELTAASIHLARILQETSDAFVTVRSRPSTVYDNLDVRVWSVAGNRCRVEAEGIVRMAELPLESLSAEGPSEADPSGLAEYGQALFRSIVSGAHEAAFRRLREQAVSRKRGLRIQLHLRGPRRLHAIPWELLHDGARFLSLGRGTSIARCFEGAARPAPRVPSGPVRVLLTISSPRSLAWLDGDRERELLCGAVAPLVMAGLMEIDIAPDGSVDTLRRMLRAADDLGRPYHLWHFIGHGAHDAGTARTTLVMTAANREADLVGGWELGTLFGEHSELRLVFLNACDGGRGENGSPMSGAATALIEAGVPAVVAMQWPISDQAAMVFAEEFYGALTDGADLDDAVVDARRGVFFRSRSSEWATPVVFVRECEDGNELFQPSVRTRK